MCSIITDNQIGRIEIARIIIIIQGKPKLL
jgi:hypothetical protein